ncbi:hypothetical protein F4804DRAFT_148822 [Jackrogersella minutella]|nr:hypothetical protein F4804DRAFT_148822 [Jackrogersella minutella]
MVLLSTLIGTTTEANRSSCWLAYLALFSRDTILLQRNLPIPLNDNHKIIGDKINTLVHALPYLNSDGVEDIRALVATPPLVKLNRKKHFVEEGKYESEIWNLLKCQGGSCPGTPKSPDIIRLLRKSSNGRIVIERFNTLRVLESINSPAA